MTFFTGFYNAGVGAGVGDLWDRMSHPRVEFYVQAAVDVYAQHAHVSVYKLADLKLLSTKKVSLGCALG